MSSDYTCPEKELFFVPMNDNFIFINADDCGTILLVKIQEGLHEVHISMKEGVIGSKLKCIIEHAIEWGYDHIVGLNEMIARIPSFNHKAIGLAKRIGFDYQGIDNMPFIKDGISYDQHIYILKKEARCLEQQH